MLVRRLSCAVGRLLGRQQMQAFFAVPVRTVATRAPRRGISFSSLLGRCVCTGCCGVAYLLFLLQTLAVVFFLASRAARRCRYGLQHLCRYFVSCRAHTASCLAVWSGWEYTRRSFLPRRTGSLSLRSIPCRRGESSVLCRASFYRFLRLVRGVVGRLRCRRHGLRARVRSRS